MHRVILRYSGLTCCSFFSYFSVDEDIKAEEMREVLDGRKEIEEFDEELYRKLIKQICDISTPFRLL